MDKLIQALQLLTLIPEVPSSNLASVTYCFDCLFCGILQTVHAKVSVL